MSDKALGENQPVVTDAEIEAAFAGANFGAAIPRKLLEQGVLKAMTGYSSGYTLTTIMRKLGLVTEGGRTTVKGRRFAFAAFHQSEHCG
jgi:hypothetical protein